MSSAVAVGSPSRPVYRLSCDSTTGTPCSRLDLCGRAYFVASRPRDPGFVLWNRPTRTGHLNASGLFHCRCRRRLWATVRPLDRWPSVYVTNRYSTRRLGLSSYFSIFIAHFSGFSAISTDNRISTEFCICAMDCRI
jgi:hypothetical protein